MLLTAVSLGSSAVELVRADFGAYCHAIKAVKVVFSLVQTGPESLFDVWKCDEVKTFKNSEYVILKEINL